MSPIYFKSMWILWLASLPAIPLQAWAVQWCFASREHFKPWCNISFIWYEWFTFNWRQAVHFRGSTKGMYCWFDMMTDEHHVLYYCACFNGNDNAPRNKLFNTWKSTAEAWKVQFSLDGILTEVWNFVALTSNLQKYFLTKCYARNVAQ